MQETLHSLGQHAMQLQCTPKIIIIKYHLVPITSDGNNEDIIEIIETNHSHKTAIKMQLGPDTIALSDAGLSLFIQII